MFDIFNIELPFPPSVNNYKTPMYNFKKRVTYMTRTAKGKAYRKEVHSMLLGCPTFSMELSLKVVLCPPDRRRRDLDNYCKALFDGMNKLIYDDDSQIKELHLSWGEVVKGGKVYIKINPLTPPEK